MPGIDPYMQKLYTKSKKEPHECAAPLLLIV